MKQSGIFSIKKHVILTALLCGGMASNATAQSEPVLAPTISTEQLRAMNASGLTLGMTLDEAKATLESKGFAGEIKFQGPYMTGQPRIDNGSGKFQGIDGVIDIKTFEDAGKINRVWAIRYTENFEQAQDQAMWKERMLKRYGDSPSRDDKVRMNSQPDALRVVYSVRALPPSDISELQCKNWATRATRDTCYALEDLTSSFHHSSNVQGLVAYVYGDGIEIRLIDYSYIEAAKERIKKQAEEKMKKNSSETTVNF